MARFLSASNSTPGFNTANVDKALALCSEHAATTQLDESCLFWATQAKVAQIRFLDSEATPSENFSQYRDHFLCFKCSHWIPDVHFDKHLACGELLRFLTSHPSQCFLIPARSELCHRYSTFSRSEEEDNFWRQHHLGQEDWPAICSKCSAIVMSTVLPLHRSSQAYCAQATLATTLSQGILTRSRFSFYPGHPLYHLFFIGNWPVTALLISSQFERRSTNLLCACFLRLLALSTTTDILLLSAPVILQIMGYCGSTSEMGLLADLVDLILRNKLELAKELVKLHRKACLSRLNTDRFGLSRW